MSLAGPDTVIAKAKKFEQGNDYARAIETYLSLSQQDTSNIDVLEQVCGWGAVCSGRVCV